MQQKLLKALETHRNEVWRGFIPILLMVFHVEFCLLPNNGDVQKVSALSIAFYVKFKPFQTRFAIFDFFPRQIRFFVEIRFR